MSSKTGPRAVETPDMLIFVQELVGIGGPGIRCIAIMAKFEICGKTEFVADVGRERILTIFIETPVVEGRGIAAGKIGRGRKDKQVDWFLESSFDLVCRNLAL